MSHFEGMVSRDHYLGLHFSNRIASVNVDDFLFIFRDLFNVEKFITISLPMHSLVFSISLSQLFCARKHLQKAAYDLEIMFRKPLLTGAFWRVFPADK
jgi:hypothetical protein